MKRTIPSLAAVLLLLACGTAQNQSNAPLYEVGAIEMIGYDEGIAGPIQGGVVVSHRYPMPVKEYVRHEIVGDRLFLYCRVGEWLSDRAREWREVYGVEDDKIAFLGTETPQPVTRRQTNITETITYEYPNP